MFNNKRNKSSYDVAGVVSDQELQLVIKVAAELQDKVKAWLQQSYPELLKS